MRGGREWGGTGIWWLVAREAAKYPSVHKTAHMTKNPKRQQCRGEESLTKGKLGAGPALPPWGSLQPVGIGGFRQVACPFKVAAAPRAPKPHM